MILDSSLSLLGGVGVAGADAALGFLMSREDGTDDVGSGAQAVKAGIKGMQSAAIKELAETTPAYFTTTSPRRMASLAKNPFQRKAFEDLAKSGAVDITGIGNADMRPSDSSKAAKVISKLPDALPGAKSLKALADAPVVNTLRDPSSLGQKGQKMGLVFARPSVMERAAAEINSGSAVKRLGNRTIPATARVSTLDSLAAFRQNRQIAEAVEAASRAGHQGDAAVRFISKQYGPKVAQMVSTAAAGTRPGEIINAAPIGKGAKVLGALPILGSAIDAYNVYDEFTDPDSTTAEKVAAVGDFALGLTGGSLVLDLVSASKGHDGFFSMLVGDQD